ncbi:MAG: glycosyltransferase [Candidatus Pacebacteria bacterium]|nr:glycosyltransferase [Candidatus Paceibacterota bacterium]
MKPHISIVIVHYNTDKDTKECLDSLAKIKAKGFTYAIIVVDNGSKTPLSLKRKKLTKEVEVLRSEANLGFTGGNNIGIRHALETYNSDYILLLNADTVVKPDFLTQLFKRIKAEPQSGMVSPKIYFAAGKEFHQDSYSKKDHGQVLWYAGGSIDWQNLLAFHRGVDELDRGHFDHQQQSDFATGCCVLIKRELLEKLRWLDKRYFLYLEDVDWSKRVKDAGYQLLFEPQAVIWHKNAGASEGAGSDLHQYYQTRNRLLFFFQHGSLKSRLTAFFWLLRLLKQGSTLKKQAVLDFLLNRFGKQPVI